MVHAFPLAIISDEVSQDIERVLAFAREFQLDGIEVRSLFGRAFKDLTAEDARTIRSRFQDAGLRVAGCAAPVFKCDLDKPADAAAHLDIFKRAVEKAVDWDCDLVRVFTFHRLHTPSTPEEIRRAASHFPAMLDVVKGTRVRIGIENEYSTIVGNGAEMRDFLKLVSSPSVGIVWDPCNVLFMPGAGDPVTESYPLIAERVIHVHAKDARRENGKPPEHCSELGRGEVSFPKQIAELKRRGYKGWLSLETHWRAKALSAEAQHLPAGHGFSEGAESSSRLCMKTLVGMLGEVEGTRHKA